MQKKKKRCREKSGDCHEQRIPPADSLITLGVRAGPPADTTPPPTWRGKEPPLPSAEGLSFPLPAFISQWKDGHRAFLVAQTVKNLPTVQKTQVRSLSQADPLEKEMATHASILAWRVPWTEEPGKLWSTGSQRVGHKWETNTLHLLWNSVYYRASQVALVVKSATANAGDTKRLGFDPWVGKIPWQREWHPTPVFLPGESHGQRSLVNYGPWGHKESDTTEAT